MRYRTALASLLAGLITPLPLLLLLNGNHSNFALAAAMLATLAVALWPPISPAWYGSAIIVAAPITYTLLAGSARSSNLFGLGLIVTATAGVIVSVATGLVATLIRHWTVPAWTPLVPLAAAALLLAFIPNENANVAAIVQDIARAESDYAAKDPNHAYTCDGPNLRDILLDWRAIQGLGTTERNQAQYGSYWIQLRCEPSAHPTWFTVTATAQGRRNLTYDSRKGTIH